MMDPEFHAFCPTPRRLQNHCLSDISCYHPLRSSYLGTLPTQDHSLPLLLLFLPYHAHRPRLRSSRLPTQARKRLDRHHQPHTRSQVAVNQAMRSQGSQNCKACQASRAVDHPFSPLGSELSAPPSSRIGRSHRFPLSHTPATRSAVACRISSKVSSPSAII